MDDAHLANIRRAENHVLWRQEAIKVDATIGELAQRVRTRLQLTECRHALEAALRGQISEAVRHLLLVRKNYVPWMHPLHIAEHRQIFRVWQLGP